MHPILVSRRRVLFYLLAWVPAVILLVFIVWAAGGLAWWKAAAVLTPACAVYAFACLSPYYLCRAQPLRVAKIATLISTWTGAALAAGLVLAGCARLAAALTAGVEQRFAGILPLLFGMGILLYLLSAGLHYAFLAAEQTRAAEARTAEARSLARDAELQALRMQVDPHFLFNSLHSIAALVTVDAVRAREMCIRLSAFLRSSLGMADREIIPLREELELARSYLQVEQVRFGDRLQLHEQVEPDCEGCAIPALLLQPLVENAVKHGVAGLVEGGAIRLEVRREGAVVCLTLENAYDPEMGPPPPSGLGLAHVRRRLQVRYGDVASMQAGAHEGAYVVELRFPCESSIAVSSRV